MSAAQDRQGVAAAASHALAWLVAGNAVGLLLSVLLLAPRLNPGALTYGRWVPVHLNIQLYGWTALPLVAWLFSIYEVHRSKSAAWASPAVWAWSAGLFAGACAWLSGTSSGKIFLDWRNGSLWVFVAALCILWAVLAIAWKDGSPHWGKLRKWLSGAGIAGLAMVPISMVFAASPAVYPPIDRTTGGPTGSSLLGSTLIVVGMMLLLPRITGLWSAALQAASPSPARPHTPHDQLRRLEKPRSIGSWIFFAFCWLAFAITEAVGGTHFDLWQIGAMLCLVPWAWIIPSDWKRFSWPEGSQPWRIAAMCWWGLLVLTGVTMYFPSLLDHLKFTQALVAHSHLAMAGFTSSFCALLVVTITGKKLGGNISIGAWNIAVLLMILILAWMGWREGDGYGWMISDPEWRKAGLVFRALCGALMLAVSVVWLKNWRRQ